MGFIKLPAPAEVKYAIISAFLSTATSLSSKADDKVRSLILSVVTCTSTGRSSPMVSHMKAMIVPWKAHQSQRCIFQEKELPRLSRMPLGSNRGYVAIQNFIHHLLHHRSHVAGICSIFRDILRQPRKACLYLIHKQTRCDGQGLVVYGPLGDSTWVPWKRQGGVLGASVQEVPPAAGPGTPFHDRDGGHGVSSC
jgi:hypothetical protein